MRTRLIFFLLVLAACGKGEAETAASPPSGYEIPDEYRNCPTGGKRPSDLPTIRLPEAVEANRQQWIEFGSLEDKSGKECRRRLRESAGYYQMKINELLNKLQGQP